MRASRDRLEPLSAHLENRFMLTKPDLPDESIIACLRQEYGLPVAQVSFLPLGADRDTAVYRALVADGTLRFCKLRRSPFDKVSVQLPRFLGDLGIAQIIPPLTTRTGKLWADLLPFIVILYRFVEGRNAYEVVLSDDNWIEFGTALKAIHSAVVPPPLFGRIRRETFSPQWREMVKAFLERAEDDAFDDPVAIELAGFLRVKRNEIEDLVGRAERLAGALEAGSLEFILCHSDLHAGNMLIDANDAFYIVDWDDPVLAPKERDLMFVGGGLMGAGHTPQEEEALFYQGYGQTPIDPTALAYYRYERIIQDIADYCEQLLLTSQGGQDRERSLRFLKSIFLPGSVLEIAYASDKMQSES